MLSTLKRLMHRPASGATIVIGCAQAAWMIFGWPRMPMSEFCLYTWGTLLIGLVSLFITDGIHKQGNRENDKSYLPIFSFYVVLVLGVLPMSLILTRVSRVDDKPTANDRQINQSNVSSLGQPGKDGVSRDKSESNKPPKVLSRVTNPDGSVTTVYQRKRKANGEYEELTLPFEPEKPTTSRASDDRINPAAVLSRVHNADGSQTITYSRGLNSMANGTAELLPLLSIPISGFIALMGVIFGVAMGIGMIQKSIGRLRIEK